MTGKAFEWSATSGLNQSNMLKRSRSTLNRVKTEAK